MATTQQSQISTQQATHDPAAHDSNECACITRYIHDTSYDTFIHGSVKGGAHALSLNVRAGIVYNSGRNTILG